MQNPIDTPGLNKIAITDIFILLEHISRETNSLTDGLAKAGALHENKLQAIL